MKLFMALALLVLCLSLNAANEASSVIFVDHDKVAAAVDGRSRNSKLIDAPDLAFYGVHREKAGQIEFHEKAIDIIYVTDGDATFVTGGTLIDGKRLGPGEMSGSDIQGGEMHHLTKGDVIVVRAGIPHWFKEVPHSISYVAAKEITP